MVFFHIMISFVFTLMFHIKVVFSHFYGNDNYEGKLIDLKIIVTMPEMLKLLQILCAKYNLFIFSF